MLPPFCCNGSSDHHSRRRQHQERKMAMLTFWRDGLERQLAGLNATIATLQDQMQRDA
ncbi:MAG: sigma factor SigF [Cyanobium sp. RS427]|nr:sigma factor SigF [Cyanobium sp. RS427]